jgi:peptidoglycan/xylan/chitin deacetylase (PgdA/CDA1 family)
MKIVLRRYEVILVGSILLLSGAVIPSSWDPPRDYPRPMVQLPPKHPWIALTFDDGPHPVMTEKLLDVLREEKVPGTFFVVGKMADRYPQIIQDMAQQGNEIANHTYNHPRLTRLDDASILNELAQTRAVIRRLTGRDCVLFRPPGGDYSRQTLRVTSKAGYKMVLWSILTNDFMGATPRSMRRRILENANDGAIVLMHSGMPHTVEMLPEVIEKLRERGYHFVTVSTLLGLPTSEPYLPHDAPVAPTVSPEKSPTVASIQ